jgi:hypothetical protein
MLKVLRKSPPEMGGQRTIKRIPLGGINIYSRKGGMNAKDTSFVD